MTLDRTTPSAQTAAAVSSHELSTARIRIRLQTTEDRLSDNRLQRTDFQTSDFQMSESRSLKSVV
jgi:hypothetical protein